ncbi:MAG: 4-(cytidine 5'-diphospho)-2-C-methyl-D-erythritol kinase [Blastocatellia bacterium]|jgi:4-diphosphocytidyl-2-C-methyl-D-erythritol kinase
MALLTLPSFAKINWTLDVLGKRPDGYHELRTIYQTVGLADYVAIELTSSPGIEVVCDGAGVAGGPTNLAHRAAAAFFEATGLAGTTGANIWIRKEVPAGAGLGGGSSNAATTLLGLERLAGLSLPGAMRFALARSLGADVPLFLIGGTVLGVGRGDEVYGLVDAPPASLVIANPGVHVPTADVFRRFRCELTAPDPVARLQSFVSALRFRDSLVSVGNDLEEAVVRDYPEVGDARAALLGAGAVQAWMTGSGASVVGIFEGAGSAVSAAEHLAEHGLWARAVETIDRIGYETALGF